MGINQQKYYNYVKEFFSKNECELLTTFEFFTNKIDSNLKFKCKCGIIVENISFKKYSRAVHKTCDKCKLNNNPRRNEEFNSMSEYFKKYDCELLTKKQDYINNLTKNIKYKCKCNNIVENESYILYYLSVHKCCNNCREKVRNHRYLPFNEIKEYFIKENVELLTKKDDNYTGTNTKLTYKCKCGGIVENINYHSFMLSKYKQCDTCVKKLIKTTCLEKYGYEIPMHHPDVLENAIKNSYHIKPFSFPSGNIVQMQGYEDLALKILIETGYQENNIITSRTLMPSFTYIHDKKEKKYLPDIFIQSENKIIEVKSDRTFDIMKIQNLIKALSARKAGYDFDFWIFNKVRKDDKPNYKYKKTILKLTKL
jgi:hypothetical protein